LREIKEGFWSLGLKIIGIEFNGFVDDGGIYCGGD
jgi:hypothetical protein